MKKLFNFILILLPLVAKSQIRVENIKSDKDVLTFLKFHYLKSKKANIDYYQNNLFKNKNNDDSVLKYFYRNNKHKSIKVDLNNDGNLDLIWNGCIDKAATVLAFISNNKNGYTSELISNNIEVRVQKLIKQ